MHPAVSFACLNSIYGLYASKAQAGTGEGRGKDSGSSL